MIKNTEIDMRQAVSWPYLSYLYLWKSFCPRSQADQIPAASISFHSQFRFYPPSLLYQKPGWLCYFEVTSLMYIYRTSIRGATYPFQFSKLKGKPPILWYCDIDPPLCDSPDMLNRYFALFHIFPKPVARLAGGK